MIQRIARHVPLDGGHSRSFFGQSRIRTSDIHESRFTQRHYSLVKLGVAVDDLVDGVGSVRFEEAEKGVYFAHSLDVR